LPSKSGSWPEKIDRDISSLTKQELTEIISNESPELIELLSEFKEKLAEVKNNLHPILERQAKLLQTSPSTLPCSNVMFFHYFFLLLLLIPQGPER